MRLKYSSKPANTSWSFLKTFEAPLTGATRHESFSSGIEMISLDFTAASEVEHVFSIGRSPIIFSFHISGYGQGEVSHSALSRERLRKEPGKATISYNPGAKFKSRMFDHQHYRALNLYISPHRLFEKLEEEMDQVPDGLHRILQHSAQLPFNQEISMPPQMRMIVDQIFNCPFKGAMKKLYLESKCMELVVSELLAAKQSRAQKQPMKMTPVDRERIHLAREVLLKDLTTPPSLQGLAKRAGLNENKLNRGFKQEFGMTVYKFYQMHRINRSREILDEGRLNIDETAHLLGFFDTTHFIKHFKQYFGTTPGTYLKNSRSGRTCLLTH